MAIWLVKRWRRCYRQRLNPKSHPIYGSYVTGRDYFMVLHEKPLMRTSTGHNALQV